MTNISEKQIEIGGEKYTLFLNRKGIVSWENITKFSNKAKQMEEKYKGKTMENELSNGTEPINVTDDTNPFDYSASEELDSIEEDTKEIRQIYIKFYWIALYTNHKLSISQVTELFAKAEEEYGIQQLIELANKMVDNVNNNPQLKKLEALNQMK